MTLHRSSSAVDHYLDYVSTSGIYPNRSNAARFLTQLFSGQRLADARVLDVGGGSGLLTFWAALHGAQEVTCLEPESAGSSLGIQKRFAALECELSRPNVSLQGMTLQQFLAGRAPSPTFDIVLMHNVVNHLDESACMALHRDADAAASYRSLFRLLATHMSPGGSLMVADCARSNLWPALRLRNPFMPAIEWEKHQDPGTWATILDHAGFRHTSTRWSSFNTLGALGHHLLGNRVGAWLTLGHFISWFERRAEAQP